MLADSGARAVICEDPAQLAKLARHPRRAARSSPTGSSSTGDRPRAPSRSTSCARAARALDGRPGKPPRRSRPAPWPRSSTRRARPGRPRAACSRTRTSCRASRCPGPPRADRADERLPVPAAGARARARRPSWSRWSSAGRSSSGAATPSGSSTSSPRPGRRTSRRSRASSRRSTPRFSATSRTSAGCSGGLRLGDRRGRPPAAPAPGADGAARRPARAVEGARRVRRRLELGLTGAAPIGQEILEFFDACGILVLEGYGLTETCAASTLNTPGAAPLRHRRAPAARDRGAAAGDGELLLRGPNVFAGYHGREADGRGARGRLAAHRRPRRRGRRRVRAHHRAQEGPDHHLQRQEHLAVEHRGAAARDALGLAGGGVRRQRSYLVALLTLDLDELGALAEHAGVAPGDPAALARRPEVVAEVSAPSTPSTRGWRGSSRSSASRSSTATSTRPPAS